MAVPDQLRILVREHADHVAYRMVHPGGTFENLTFAQWHADSSRFARGLVDHGLAKGDIVGGLFTQDDALGQVRAYAGIHKAGGVHVPVNAKFTPAEVTQVLLHAEPRWLVVSPALRDLAASILEDLPSVEHVVSTGTEFELAAGWDEFVSDDDSDIQVDVDDDDISDIIYTSGTTGRPKGVVLRHRNALALSSVEPSWNGMGFFHASPLFTTAGLSFVYVPMQLGATATYMSRFDAKTFLDLAELRRIQLCFLVPAFVELLLAEPDIEDRDLSEMYMVTVGSAPIAPATLQRLQDLMPDAMISNGFGLTESGSAHMALPKGELEKRPGAVGKPQPPVEAKIIDGDGDKVPAGVIGEVCLRNPGQEREYYKDPEATSAAWIDGWLHTGDLGKLDQDGYLYIVGRIKDVIIRGGHNVHAADVENVLYSHDDVLEAAVVGIPHDVLGEEVAAAVVLRPDAGCTPDDLVEWCKERVAGYAYPRTVSVVEALPRNATGKVLKRDLSDRLAKTP